MSPLNKKIILGGVIIVAIGGFIFWSSSQTSSTAPVSTDTTSVPSETANPVSTATTTTTGTGSSAAGTYKDGTYTGTTANSEYGNVQVSATISGGALTDISFIQMPSEQGHTAQVTAMAEPTLKSEAIAAQSSSVDIVSGATQTSEAFQQSLQSALSQAQA
jgi:uncharacterized protein with FMN-binding domain